MKTILWIITLGSLFLAGWAIWFSQSSHQQTADQLLELRVQVAHLQQQLESVSEFQGLMGGLDVNAALPANEQQEPTKDPVANTNLGKRVKDQRRANDKQWQEIDYLKGQRIFHKQLIDQLTNDFTKLKRDFRDNEARVQDEIQRDEFTELSTKVNELYRRVFQGR